jgi:quercetin dioxygenase-like cupin family protein
MLGGRVKKSILILVAVTAATTGIARIVSSQTPDPLDPLRVAASSHKLAFENRFVRVLDVHVPVGQSEPRHRHPHGLSVYFTDWDARVTADGSPAEVHHRAAGTFAWSEATIHTVENVGKTDGHILRVELKF